MPTLAKTSTAPKKTYPDIVVLRKDDETFSARIFDDPEPFTFSTDVNGFLQLEAFSGQAGAFSELMFSMLEVDIEDDDTEDQIDRKRWDVKQRFTNLLKGQKGLSIERLIRFSVNITEIAGNALPT